jgi:AraC-like DNA-binding protein
MFDTIAFSITLLGIFSILEFLKANQKFSLLKYYMLLLLVWITISSVLDYIDLTGHPIPYYREVSNFFGTGFILNLFYILVFKKIPRIVLFIEAFIICIFIIMFFYGFQFPLIMNNQLKSPQTIYHKVVYLICSLFAIGSILFVIFKLQVKNPIQNLYEIKIKKWISRLILAILLFILVHILIFILFLNGMIPFYSTTFFSIYTVRFCLIFFILFRPKFLDDDLISTRFDTIFVKHKKLSIEKFDFIFYTSQYFLLQTANIEDLALKLNVTKNDLVNFLKIELNDSFTELLNKNRITYLKELLKAKKHESFTIEALSEMAGFNNRRTMYYAFNKYNGMTPSEYIRSIK